MESSSSLDQRIILQPSGKRLLVRANAAIQNVRLTGNTGECVFALREHSHNVQGVSWDPLNDYIATQSSDR